MNNMVLSLYNLPPAIFHLLPFLGAGALAALAWQLGGWFLPRFGSPRTARLDAFAETRSGRRTAAPEQAAVGSFEHRVRIALSRFGLDAAGREAHYLFLARLACGGLMCLALMLAGLPFLTSLVGFLAGFVFVNGWVLRVWNKTRTEMEAEIPALLLRLNAALQTDENIPSALETVARTLNGPLHGWSLELAARMHTEGHAAMQAACTQAAAISPSLAIAAELIGRAWTTGGQGYARAFGAAADNLESVLDARVLARARGGSVQGSVNILTAMTFVMIAFMTRSEALAEIVRTPLVQALYGLIALAIVYGHAQISSLIDNIV